MEQRPAIYVGTYHAYNCGSLYGKWFYLDEYSDRAEFTEAAKAYHHEESDPEFMFQDHEYIPENLISESWIDDVVWDYMGLDDDEKLAFEWLVDDHGYKAGDAIDKVGDVCLYKGQLTDYIAEFYEGCGNKIPDFVEGYIDWQKMARDWVYESQIDDVSSSHGLSGFSYYDLVAREDVTWVVNAYEF